MDKVGPEFIVWCFVGVGFYIAMTLAWNYGADWISALYRRAYVSTPGPRAYVQRPPRSGPKKRIARRVDRRTTTATAALPRVAMRSTPDNGLLPDNEPLPEPARHNEDLLWSEKLDTLERLLKAKKVGLAEGIELVFNCSRSSKPGSVYVRARQAIDDRQAPAPTTTVIAGRETFAHFERPS